VPIFGERRTSRGWRLRQHYRRAVAALAFAFVASNAIAPGVETTFAQSTALSLAQTDTARDVDDASATAARAGNDATHETIETPASVSVVPTVAPPQLAASPERGTGVASTEATVLASGADRDLQDGAQAPTQLAATTSREDALAFLAQLDAESLQPRSRGTSEPVDAEPAWQDQYLFDDGELPPLDQVATYAAQPFGRETLAVDFTSYTSADDFFGEDTERGARVYWSRETENWGTFDLDLQVADVNSTFIGRETDGSEAVVTLRQSLMPVSATSLLSTTAGHQRTPTSSLLHGGYRYRLPSSTILGFSGELAGLDGRAHVTVGNIGAYRGMRIQRFDDTGGRMASFAYERRINGQLELGAQVANISGDDDTRDHTSALIAGRVARPDDSREHAFRLLVDDNSRFGFWSDSRLAFTDLPTLRFGMSYFEPELVWGDLAIPSDQLALYVRADRGTSAFDFSAGYDFLETGLDTVAVASTVTHSAYLTAQMRVRRAFSVGATASLAIRDVETATANEDQDIERLNIYASLRNPLGTARIEAFSHRLDTPLEASRRARDGLALSMGWRTPERVRLTTELRVEREDAYARGSIERTELAALFRYDVFDDVSLGLTSSLFTTRGGSGAEDDGVSLTGDARWTINRNWRATLSVNRNRADYNVSPVDLFSTLDTAGATSVWLTVNYQRQRGQAYPTFGRTQDGMSGSGSISGEIYFDENRDSVRQPSERAAAGVVVVLDGRYEARTDAQGRYSFSPVPTGSHELAVLTEDLPLPWGLENEAPRRLVVRFRQDAPVDFPLTIMD